ncbi:hypothetical protein ACOZDZ_12420 [Streptomyces griseoincarnatus]
MTNARLCGGCGAPAPRSSVRAPSGSGSGRILSGRAQHAQHARLHRLR